MQISCRDGEFHLSSGGMSYIFALDGRGAPRHIHFGAALSPDSSYRHLLRLVERPFSIGSMESAGWECPTVGRGDFRIPALEIEAADGSGVLDLLYAGHRVIEGKPPIPGLPATYAETEDEALTLELCLRDAVSGLELYINYSIFEGTSLLVRSSRVCNRGRGALSLNSAMSAVLELPDPDYELGTLSGAWARERHFVRRRLAPGLQGISSRRGASGHQHNPFLLLSRPGATETEGECIGVSLVYSGCFTAEVEVHSHGTCRARIGIDPADFRWQLGPGQEFATPEAVLVYSARGLGELSETYNSFYRSNLALGYWRDRHRPVLFNSWEAAYFDFTENDLVGMAEGAAALGAELFVLDDGWFGLRDDDSSSLGDWACNLSKLPGGLAGLARALGGLGLGFGLWVEPEMVSQKSQLFEAHPDWVIGVPGRPRSEGRNQLVLDLSRPEVVDHLYGVFHGILSSASISYLKWDMNRHISEAYSAALPPGRQGEFFHRYMLGLYALLGRLVEAFPELLIESCSGGGGRFDPGLLPFASQAWTSDDSDAIERLSIQAGTSLVYPLSSMGAHVSAVPNHQLGRSASLDTRGAVAFFGVLGYELDPRKLSEEDRRGVAAQIAFYKQHRQLFQFGRFLRLRSTWEGDGNETAWMVVSEDRREAVVASFRILGRPNPASLRLGLRGLDPGLLYRVSPLPAEGPLSSAALIAGVGRPDVVQRENAGLRRGDELEVIGLLLSGEGAFDPPAGDFSSRLFLLEAVFGH